MLYCCSSVGSYYNIAHQPIPSKLWFSGENALRQICQKRDLFLSMRTDVCFTDDHHVGDVLDQ